MSEIETLLNAENQAPTAPAAAPAFALKDTLGNRVSLLEARVNQLNSTIAEGFALLRRDLTRPQQAPAPQLYYQPQSAPQPQQTIENTLALIKSIFSIQTEAKKSILEDLQLASEWGAPPAQDDLNLKDLISAAPSILPMLAPQQGGFQGAAPSPPPAPPSPSPSPKPEVSGVDG